MVDAVRAVNESNQGKKANAELNAFVKTKQAELKEKADAVEKLKKNLEAAPAASRKAVETDLEKASSEFQRLTAAADAEVMWPTFRKRSISPTVSLKNITNHLRANRDSSQQ